MEFLTETQKIVVQAKMQDGYAADIMPNGNYLVYKHRHAMIINCLGYDIYLKPGNARLN
jgi:hypothetical protein